MNAFNGSYPVKKLFHKLHEKCPKFFSGSYSGILTEHGEIWSISPYSVRLRENTDQKKLRIWKLFTQYQLQNTLKQLRGNIKELNSGDIIKLKMLSKDFHHLLWLLYGKIFHRTSFFPKIKFLYTCFTVNWFFDQLDQAVFEYFWLHEHSFTGERNTV